MVFILIIVALFTALVGGVGYAVFKAVREQSEWIERTRRILDEGRPSTAVVTAMGPTSRGKSVFAVDLDVQPAGEAPFSTRIEVFVPPYAAAAFGPGKRVAVRYVPVERAVAIDYPAMGFARPPGW